MSFPWPDESIFEPFDIFEETYKTIDSHEIKAAILTPKTLAPGKHPVLFNIHGGFLTYAHSLFPDFIQPWVTALALENDAIMVSPDYRLLPTANGVGDILQDLEDFWTWAKTDLQGVLEKRGLKFEMDFERLLVSGGSAGGFAAAQLALSHPDEMNAVAMAYPLLDIHDKLYIEGVGENDATLFNAPREKILSKQETLTWMEDQRKVFTVKAGFERLPFSVAMCHHGLYYSHLLDNKNLQKTEFSPLRRLQAGAKLPKSVWISHGDADDVVYLRGTEKFVKVIEDIMPDVSVRLDVVPGVGHGFDFSDFSGQPVSTWKDVRQPAMDFVRNAWLGM